MSAGNVENYTDRVPPEAYLRQIRQHPQITEASRAMAQEASWLMQPDPSGTLLNIGCGPGRDHANLRRTLSAETTIVGIDPDPVFMAYASKHNATQGRAELLCTKLEDYVPRTPARVAMMMGVFHHIPEPEIAAFLRAAHNCIEPGGHLLVGDEFIPPYQSEAERKRNLIPWYSQVIATAVQRRHTELAAVESLSLAGDLLGGTSPTEIQVAMCLENATGIWQAVQRNNRAKSEKLIDQFLTRFFGQDALEGTTEPGLGDVKRSIIEYQRIFAKHGFELVNVATFSPYFSTVGGMANLTFRPL